MTIQSHSVGERQIRGAPRGASFEHFGKQLGRLALSALALPVPSMLFWGASG